MKNPERLVVTATGTEIGKTFVTAALLRELRAAHHRVLALKPVESGYAQQASDAAALALGQPLIEPCYALPTALSPHRAARLAGCTIELDKVIHWIEHHERARQVALTLIETAGGLFTPLTLRECNLDLVRALEPCRWVLVAPNRLGVLHDVQAAVRAARAGHRAPDAVLLNSPLADASSSTNLEDLRDLKLVPHVFTFTLPLGEPLRVWVERQLGAPEAPPL